MRKIDLVCIIDDDPIFVYGVRKLIELSGICNDFMIHENGETALNALKSRIDLKRKLPDLIFLDINMPVMDGWEFLDKIIELDIAKELHIYIISSSMDPSDIKKASTYNLVNKYAIKPIHLADVKSLLLGFMEEDE